VTAFVITLVLLGTPLACAQTCPAPEGVTPVEMAVGTQKVLNFAKPVQRASVDGSATAELRSVGNSQYLIVVTSEGVANVSATLQDGSEQKYRVRARKLDIDSCGISDIWKLLPCESEIGPRYTPAGGFELVGQYRNLDDVEALRALRKTYAERSFGIRLPPVPVRLVAEAVSKANAALERAGSTVRVRHLGKGMVLVSDPPANEAAMKIAAEILAPHRELLLDLAEASE
jgi:hypothetical protein